jgi:hypothetical protein
MNSSPDRRARPIGPTSSEEQLDVPDNSILEQVLRETLEVAELSAPPKSSNFAELLELARQHSDEPLVVEPLGREIVHLLLRARFPHLPLPQESWDHVTREIATKLMEDPHQQILFHKFWAKLCAEAA